MVAMGIIYPPNPILIIKAPILPLEGFRCEGFGVKAWGVGLGPTCSPFPSRAKNNPVLDLWRKATTRCRRSFG